ncbi:MAG: single-stranded DNA-binding protein [Chitinophagales bacterium]|nr:single-stranded DNA-binding protein [Chitinophagaceae bacterium]MBP9882471.1 single-stranded DNA-binding protein [Chitinophagales bacterium]
MRGVNKVILVGHLGKDPEVNHLEGGLVVAKFSLATSEAYNDKSGNRVEQTEWHNIICWRKLAETAEKYLKKGSAIYLEGKIKSSSYTDKENIKRYRTDIVADTFTMLDRKPESGNNGSTGEPVTTDGEAPIADDLPF